MTLIRISFGLILLCGTAISSQAMEFRTGTWKGHPALYGEGEIVPGDARKLATLGKTIPPIAHGYRLIILNSPGGDVDEAFEVSKELMRHKMHTIVPNGSSCQSACGAILFISGSARTVEEGGAIGLHTCYEDGNGKPLPECNDSIAYNAIAHGVSHGSLKAAMDYAPPERMILFSRELAECYGLSRYAGSSDFDRIEPCVINILTGRHLPAQAVWRIDIEERGFSAFTRVKSDYELAGQIKVFCRESDGGKLYFQALIPGKSDEVRKGIYEATVGGLKVPWSTRDLEVTMYSAELAAVQFALPSIHVKDFLLRTTTFQLRYALRPPYGPIELKTSVASSRKNLIFAANHCLP